MLIKTALTLQEYFNTHKTSKRMKSKYLGGTAFSSLYVRAGRNKLVFSNIELPSELRGNGLFTDLLVLMDILGIAYEVECPSDRLTAYCKKHGITYSI